MLARILVVGLTALAFGAGYFVGLPDPQAGEQINNSIEVLEAEREQLSRENEELRETMALVKRQIQTDRIAYDNLQRSVEASEQSRLELEQKLASQRELLDRIRQRLQSE